VNIFVRCWVKKQETTWKQLTWHFSSDAILLILLFQRKMADLPSGILVKKQSTVIPMNISVTPAQLKRRQMLCNLEPMKNSSHAIERNVTAEI
jgi:hypothetical protein